MTNETTADLADRQQPVRTVSAVRAPHLLAAPPRDGTGSAAGRFGLSRPEAGERFGMMRLTTLGRRSGHDPGGDRRLLRGRPEPRDPGDERLGTHGARVVAEPPGEPGRDRRPRRRAPRGASSRRRGGGARAAVGRGSATTPAGPTTSTPRLHGDRRPTAVVVLEPRGAAVGDTSPRRSVAHDAISVDADAAPHGLALRHLWLIPGLGLALFANAQSTTLRVGTGPAPACSGSCPTCRPCSGSVSRTLAASWLCAPCPSSTPCISPSCRWRCSASRLQA